MEKHLAKRLITDAVNKWQEEYGSIYLVDKNQRDNLIQQMYGDYLVGLKSLEDIREEIKKAFEK